MIRFHDGEPIGIYYSQHRDGASYQWDDEAVSKQDGRVSNSSFADASPFDVLC